jgi:hypothetical protein
MRILRASALVSLLVLVFSLAGCGQPPNGNDAGPIDSGAADSGADAGPVDAGPSYTPACTAAIAPACTDQSIPGLDLKKPVGTGLITNAAVDGGWVSVVDSTAGTPPGSTTPTESYVYAKFTPTGLTKVMLGDEAALDSMAWDIAFRRYVIRLNGSYSGSSCVGAATLPLGASYDGLTAEPSGAVYKLDSFYSATPAACTFVPDLIGNPATALSTFYEYNGCVKTTGLVYALRTAEGRHLKLTIDAYYFPLSAQTYCNANNAKAAGSTAGNLSMRWAFLD